LSQCQFTAGQLVNFERADGGFGNHRRLRGANNGSFGEGLRFPLCDLGLLLDGRRDRSRWLWTLSSHRATGLGVLANGRRWSLLGAGWESRVGSRPLHRPGERYFIGHAWPGRRTAGAHLAFFGQILNADFASENVTSKLSRITRNIGHGFSFQVWELRNGDDGEEGLQPPGDCTR